MIILDSDILSILLRDESLAALRVRARIAQLPPGQVVATTIVTYQEQTRGWLGYISKARTKPQVIFAYSLLQKHLSDFRESRVLPFDQAASDRFDELRIHHRRLGTMDLRIAAIALANNAILLTRNLKDFTQIPALEIEDWTQP